MGIQSVKRSVTEIDPKFSDNQLAIWLLNYNVVRANCGPFDVSAGSSKVEVRGIGLSTAGDLLIKAAGLGCTTAKYAESRVNVDFAEQNPQIRFFRYAVKKLGPAIKLLVIPFGDESLSGRDL